MDNTNRINIYKNLKKKWTRFPDKDFLTNQPELF